MKEFLENISLIHWIVVGIVTALIPFLIFIRKYILLQFRFANNLRRRIYFLRLEDSASLVSERDLVGKTKLFNVEKDIYKVSDDPKVLQLMERHSLFVIGYDAKYRKYKELIDKAQENNTPIIIYAKQGEIKNSSHWKLFNNYIYCDVANTSSRLTVIILNTMYIV